VSVSWGKLNTFAEETENLKKVGETDMGTRVGDKRVRGKKESPETEEKRKK